MIYSKLLIYSSSIPLNMTDTCHDFGFSIFLTDSGLGYVYTDLEFQIMEILSEGDIALADLSKMLDAPVSTVLFNINKLVSKRLVVQYRDDADRRKTFYGISAVKLITSAKINPDLKEPELLAADILVDKHRWFKEKIEYASLISINKGMDLGPTLEVYNRVLADGMSEKFKDRFPDAVVDYAVDFLNSAGVCHMTVISNKPVTIRVSKECVTSVHLKCPSVCGLSFVCRALEICTGIPHAISPPIFDDVTFTVTYVIKPCSKNTESYEKLLSDENLLNMNGIAAGFCIITDVNGRAHMIENDLQTMIVQSLDRHPCTLKMLADEIGGSASTVFSNMTKLESMGIICTDRTLPGPNYYENCGLIILQQTKVRVNNNKNAKESIAAAVTDPSQYFVSMFKFLLLVFESAGIDTGKFQNYLGKKFYRATHVSNDSIKLDEMILAMCREDKVMCSKVILESFIPLTLNVRSSGFNRTGTMSMAEFYIGAIQEAILLKIGRRYDVTGFTDDTGADGAISFIFVLEPDGYKRRFRDSDN